MMRFYQYFAIATLCAGAFLPQFSVATPTPGDKPADVYLRGGSMAEIIGTAVRFDDRDVIIKTSHGERTLHWLDLTGPSAFGLRSRLIDPISATDQLALGEMGWSMGMKDQAKAALGKAVKLDSSLKEKVDAILATEPGAAVKPAAGAAVSSSASPTNLPTELMHSSTGRALPRPAPNATKYTPEQDAAAIEGARQRAAEAQAAMDVKLAEFQTAHFIVFTDWDPREYDFLKTNLEGAYAAVAKVFDLSPLDNIFMGKLPVYMLAQRETFEDFRAKVDKFPAQAGMAGYYAYRGAIDHMAMWKPQSRGNTHQAEIAWGRVLSHEFTHAFVHHYRTQHDVPRWLNEGLAEAVSADLFPYPQAYIEAIALAKKYPSIEFLFTDDEKDKEFQYYPAHRTLTETLIVQDRKAFVAMFKAIKDGVPTEDAIKQNYKWDYAQLNIEWRNYLDSHR